MRIRQQIRRMKKYRCMSGSRVPDWSASSFDLMTRTRSFIDWLPGILTTLGLVVVSLVDKETLLQGDGHEVWRARFVLFIGFALMAGGLAGSVVVLTIKYVIGKYGDRFLYYGYAAVGQVSVWRYLCSSCALFCLALLVITCHLRALMNVVRLFTLSRQAVTDDLLLLQQNITLMLGAVVLWLATQSNTEYEYSLTL